MNLTELPYEDLVNKSKDIFQSLSCSSKQAKVAEEVTRCLSKSNLWFRLRAGRVTASKFHGACYTNPASPSISLIKEICYGTKKFHSKATDWGCTHEKTALNQYEKIMRKTHMNFSVKESGLLISPKYPHIGASPDAISSCQCHGKGCVEIKCPFCVKDSTFADAFKAGVSLCLESSNNGLKLRRNHPYWSQVQVQLGVSEFEHADFVIWTTQDIHIERIQADNSFFESQLSLVNKFYFFGILPELLTRWHTREKSKKIDLFDEMLYCYCRCGDDASLILSCGNLGCIFKKFHLNCCGLTRRPSSKKVWYCVECRKWNKMNSTSNDARQP